MSLPVADRSFTPHASPPDIEGLCNSCNLAPSCMYLRRALDTIWRCEEFDDSTPAAHRAQLAVVPDAPTRADTLPGLCCNCDNRTSCLLPKRPGGVWHCEEYL